MLLEARVPSARLCAPQYISKVTGGFRLPAYRLSPSASLQRVADGRRKAMIGFKRAKSVVRSSTVKELTPLTQSPAGNPLARLYVALLPGASCTL